MEANNIQEVKYSADDMKKIEMYDEASGYHGVESFSDDLKIKCAKASMKELNKEVKKLVQKGIDTPKLDQLWGRMTMYLGLKLSDKILDDMAKHGEVLHDLSFAINQFREQVAKDLGINISKEK